MGKIYSSIDQHVRAHAPPEDGTLRWPFQNPSLMSRYHLRVCSTELGQRRAVGRGQSAPFRACWILGGKTKATPHHCDPGFLSAAYFPVLLGRQHMHTYPCPKAGLKASIWTLIQMGPSVFSATTTNLGKHC